MDRQAHGIGLGKCIEDAGSGKIEFARERLTRMKSAIGQATQQWKQRLVGSGGHERNFTWLGHTNSQ